MNTGNVPQHLNVAARTGFLTSLKMPDMPWQRIATTLNMDARAQTLVDLGGTPMPVESRGGGVAQDMIEKTMDVRPIDWEIITWISVNAVSDDQTGNLLQRVQGAAVNFQKHLNNRVFTKLNGGDGGTYGLAYDGQYFFDSDHVDKGAHYTSNQSNVNTSALSFDNFNTVRVAAQKYLDDQGEYVNYVPDLLIVPPELETLAAQLTSNKERYDTANRGINPFEGKTTYIVSPQLDATAWYLIDTAEPTKPLIVVMREQPHLQGSWEDLTAADGGRYYFKFFGRYEVYYGDWRLATQGNT